MYDLDGDGKITRLEMLEIIEVLNRPAGSERRGWDGLGSRGRAITVAGRWGEADR